MAIILADSREHTGAIPYLDAYIAENNRLAHSQKKEGEITFSIEQIAIGDYGILLGEERKLTIVFERKTWKDLAASIKDKRMEDQYSRLEQLRQQTGCKIYYIIEGKLGYTETTKIANIPFKNLHAKLRRNLLRDQSFIQTKDQQHTALTIVNFARDVLNMGSGLVICPPIITEISTLISRLAGGKNDQVIKHLEDAVALLKISQSQSEGDGESEKSSAVNSDGISRVAPAVLTIRKVVKNCDIHQAMWTTLKGISSTTAQILVKKYNIVDIITMHEENIPKLVKEISNITYSNGTRLGDRAEIITSIASDV